MDSKLTDAQACTVSQNPHLSLAGVQDISLVQSLYQQLSDALEADLPITFDVSQTERLDTAVGQLLLAFSQAARAKNQAVIWQQPSEAFLSAVRLLGIEDQLGLAS